MDIMHRLLVIDEQSAAGQLIESIVNVDREYSILFTNSGTEAERILKAQELDMILLNVESKVCLKIAELLKKNKDCPPFSVLAKLNESTEAAKAVEKLKPVEKIILPFEIEDFALKLEKACFTAKGLIDDFTGLYKMAAFELKTKKLMQKDLPGIFFCLSLNAYSYAANPTNRLQIQMAVFVLKNNLTDSLLGINNNIVMGFIPTDEPEKTVEKRLNALIADMLKTAEGSSNLFIPAGAVQSERYNFSFEDMVLYADKAMELSGNEGKHLVKFYR